MNFIEIVSALLVPLIAIITTYIAVQQYRLEKARLKFELFEKRYMVFRTIMETIGTVTRKGRVTQEELSTFAATTRQGFFLFGDDVNFHVDQIYDKCNRLDYVFNRLADQGLRGGEERNRLDHENSEIFNWFQEQINVTKTLFARYLQIWN